MRSFRLRLERLALQLEQLAADLRSIAVESESIAVGNSKAQKRSRYPLDTEEIIRLRELGREGAERELGNLTQKQLGDLLRALGGSSEEAKRAKEHIIQRILYRVFDFSTSHALLKGDEGSDRAE